MRQRRSLLIDRLMRPLHWLAVRMGVDRMVHAYLNAQHAEGKLDRRTRWLFQLRHARGYLPVIGGLAVLASATCLYPFGPVIIAATVLAPNRWLGIIATAAVGAASGGTLLVAALQWLGGGAADRWFPGWRGMEQGFAATYGLAEHGELALGVIAALPVPQLPALVLAALNDMPLPAVAAALLIGKGIKYATYGLGVLAILRGAREVADWQPASGE